MASRDNFGKKPTPAQLGKIHEWLSRKAGGRIATEAVSYLENNATRGEVSKEVSRIWNLEHGGMGWIAPSVYFAAPVWEGFDWETMYAERIKRILETGRGE